MWKSNSLLWRIVRQRYPRAIRELWNHQPLGLIGSCCSALLGTQTVMVVRPFDRSFNTLRTKVVTMPRRVTMAMALISFMIQKLTVASNVTKIPRETTVACRQHRRTLSNTTSWPKAAKLPSGPRSCTGACFAETTFTLHQGRRPQSFHVLDRESHSMALRRESATSSAALTGNRADLRLHATALAARPSNWR